MHLVTGHSNKHAACKLAAAPLRVVIKKDDYDAYISEVHRYLRNPCMTSELGPLWEEIIKDQLEANAEAIGAARTGYLRDQYATAVS